MAVPRQNTRARITQILCFLALASLGCEEMDLGSDNYPLPADPAGELSLGVGDRTLKIAPCIVRGSRDTGAWQLVARTPRGPSVYVEFPYKGERLASGEKITPIFSVVTLNEPLQPDEERVYRGHNLLVLIDDNGAGEKSERQKASGQVRGRLRGSVEDLQRGRTHEIRARFECAIDPGP